jgi:GNAT superfamily N-acetyltransferase
MSDVRIEPVETARQLATVRALFEEYWAAFGFTPCFQHFDEEVAHLPGGYAPPDGRLALALVGDETAGCVAMRRFDATRCELKRLFVRPAFRGLRIGHALFAWVIDESRRAGYREALGDTMPHMRVALDMYARFGFERIEPYAAEPSPGAICIRLAL